MSKKMINEIETALTRFEKAVREDAWKGGGHPDDKPFIEQEYKESKYELIKLIKAIMLKACLFLIFVSCSNNIPMRELILEWEHDGDVQGFVLFVEGVEKPLKIDSVVRHMKIRIPLYEEKCFILRAYEGKEYSQPATVCTDSPQEDDNEGYLDRYNDSDDWIYVRIYNYGQKPTRLYRRNTKFTT